MIFLISNALIFHHVHNSSRRIQPQMTMTRRHSTRISHRDAHLLQHIIVMFIVFVGGWAPAYILVIVEHYINVSPIIEWILSFCCDLALLLNIIDLFLYNHELRRFIKEICLWGCRS